MRRGGALVAERRGRAPVGGAKCLWAGPMACGRGQATVGGARGREVGPACLPEEWQAWDGELLGGLSPGHPSSQL